MEHADPKLTFIDYQEKTKCNKCKNKCVRKNVGYQCNLCDSENGSKEPHTFNICDSCFDPQDRHAPIVELMNTIQDEDDMYYKWKCNKCNRESFTKLD